MHRVMSAIALAVVLMLGLADCGGGGTTSSTSVQNTTVSKGQQLIDLKRALDAGAISQSTYDSEHAKILASP